MKRTIALTGGVLAAIGFEAQYHCLGRLMVESWFVPVCSVLLIILSLLFVLVSCVKASKERELKVNVGQLFAEYVPELDPGEQDLHIMLSTVGGRSLNESEVFAVGPDDKNKTKIGKGYSLVRLINRGQKGRRISYG